MNEIKNLQDVAETLEALGKTVNLKDEAVILTIGSADKPCVAILTVDEIGNKLVLTAPVTTLANVAAEDRAEFQLALLDLNNDARIMPFAYAAIVPGEEEGVVDFEDTKIVLTDSMPLGDLSFNELNAEVSDLIAALEATFEIFKDVVA